MQNKYLVIGKIQIPTENILYLKAECNYTKIHLLDNKKFLSAYNLGLIEENLCSKSFVRINRSVTINLKMITDISQDLTSITCDGNEVIKVSRRRVKDLKKIKCIYNLINPA